MATAINRYNNFKAQIQNSDLLSPGSWLRRYRLNGVFCGARGMVLTRLLSQPSAFDRSDADTMEVKVVPLRSGAWKPMTPTELATTLSTVFPGMVQSLAPGSYQVEGDRLRLLILLSDDQSWLRVLVPIAPANDAQPFWEQLLEANFDDTQEVRYALSQGVLWGVFQHSCAGLTSEDFIQVLHQLVRLNQQGLTACFNQFVEQRVRQIIQAAKQQGQSLEMTMQTLERFYQEGVMGDLSSDPRSREEVLSAWRYQLERLWEE